MPKALHNKLARQARKQGLSGDRFKAYVYGTMNKIEQGKQSHFDKAIRKRMKGAKS